MAVPSLNVLSLFSGAGGLDLGFRRAVPHARTVGYVEIEAYAAAILAARGEEGALDLAPIWSSVITFDGRPWRGKVDCVIGGFPCTDISDAGKRAGFIDAEGNRTRSGLWFEYARIIDEVQPRFVFIENVAALARRGLDIVLRSLASMGFDAEWGVYSAAEAGAPHKRERLFLLAWHPDRVAHAHSIPDERWRRPRYVPGTPGEAEGQGHQRERRGNPSDDREQALADDDDDGRQGVGSGGVPDGVRARPEGAKRGRDAHGSRGPTPEVGDADRERECEQDHETATVGDGRAGSRSDAGRSGERWPMGHHHHPGLEGRGMRDGGCSDEGIAWPPGPEDVLGWREYLERYPDCAPAVEPELRQRSHGMAPALDGSVLVSSPCLCDRIDRLRAAGNGVVPAQAELALRDLIERAGAAAKFLRGDD